MSSLLVASTRAPRRILATELCVSYRQTRLVSRDRMAPHLRNKKQGPYVLTPERQAMLERLEGLRAGHNEDFKAQLEDARMEEGEEVPLKLKMYKCRTTVQAAQDMTTRQAIFLWSYIGECDRTQSVPADHIHGYLERLDPMSLDDVYDLTFILRNKGTVACAQRGRRLVNICAELGHTEATIQVVASALRQAATKPEVLRSRNVVIALDRLRDVAKTGNVRALVMEANVARHLGRVDQAIKQYQKAIDLILEDDGKQPGDKYSRIQDELSSPWIELAYLHHTQGQMVAAMKAYLAGQEKDDPMAFFNLARLDLYMAGEHSHDWLYNMTKAAASGHYIAAHELGEYYANSAANPSKPEQSFMEKLTGFFKFLSKPNINLNPKTNIHHHDAFANTPQLRVRLAHEWFLTARQNHYLFANISLAQLYLQKLIYPKDTLTKPLDPHGHSDDPDAMDNPLFEPAKAQIVLTEVLTACLRIAEAKSVSKTNAEYIHMARPWSNHQEVLEAVEDSKTLQELKDQAEMIADAAGIDIYSTIGLAGDVPRLGFIRAHKGTRGEGLFEMPLSLEEQLEQAAEKLK
jgi:tetratricopeptide (TPR) repeat protein